MKIPFLLYNIFMMLTVVCTCISEIFSKHLVTFELVGRT